MRRQNIFSVFIAISLTVLAGAGVAYAAELTSVAPTPANSEPNAGHVFMIRKAKGMGVQPTVHLASYTKAVPSTGTFRLAPGTGKSSSFVCDKKDTGMTAAEKNRYISVTVGDADGSPQRTSYIPYTHACDINANRTNTWDVNANNVFYANYNIPNGNYDIDEETGMYKVEITIAYHDSVPNGSTSPNLVQQRFRVSMSMGSAKVGPFAQGVRAFPIVGDWDEVMRDPNQRMTIRIPFGLPCSTTTGGNRAIGVYDADNGVFTYKMKFKVQRYDYATDKWVTITMVRNSETGGGTISGGTTFIPGNTAVDSATYQGVSIPMSAHTRYQMVIEDLMPRNTIDIKVPGDTIYGAIDCRWNMQPTSKVTPAQQLPGGQVKFTHTSKNTGASKTLDVTSTVRWGKTGQRTSGVLNTDTRKYAGSGDAGDSASWSNNFTIPADATPGQTYCQYLRVNPRQSAEPATDRDSTPACVTVLAPPPLPSEPVNVKPVVDNGPDIEPTETTMLAGRVIVSNFPSRTEWGYNEVASYGTPRKIGPTQERYGSTSVVNEGAATQGNCTATNSSGTCTQWEYFCSGQLMGKFSTAQTCYRHRCQSYTAFTTNGTVGSYQCWDKWTCPSPSTVATTYTTTTPDAGYCKLWQCPYNTGTTGYYYDTAADGNSPGHCERRCRSGTGPASDLAGNPPGDFNCYQQPSFTLTCDWDDSSAPTTVTVRANGTYCSGSSTRVGGAIGSSVCAELEAESSYRWTPDPPRPGYGSSDGGTTFRQLKEWGWNVEQPANGCSRVVGKPTFKVFGGDVAVGGSFGSCVTGPSSSIVAWPHSDVFDASYTQYAGFASSQIYGFATAAIRSNDNTTPASGLAFANTSKSGERYGGSFNPMPCMNNYADVPPFDGTTGSLNANNPSGNYEYNANTLGGTPKIRPGKQIVLYHIGSNLHINSNILYDRSTAWTTTADIPALKVIVIGGDITIDPNVSELNGVFVAQSVGGIGGNIRTCATQTGKIADALIYNECRKTKLTVNGAFIANKVFLGRTGGGSATEGGTAIRGQTSEEFRYLPEVWLAPWPRDNTSTTVKYDAMTSLPPIL